MNKKIIAFCDNKIEKRRFHRYENLIFLEDVYIDKILMSNKIFSSRKNFKYFIGYMDDDYKTEAFSIILPKTSVYVKRYDGETLLMFGTKSAILLKKYLIANPSSLNDF